MNENFPSGNGERPFQQLRIFDLKNFLTYDCDKWFCDICTNNLLNGAYADENCLF